MERDWERFRDYLERCFNLLFICFQIFPFTIFRQTRLTLEGETAGVNATLHFADLRCGTYRWCWPIFGICYSCPRQAAASSDSHQGHILSLSATRAPLNLTAAELHKRIHHPGNLHPVGDETNRKCLKSLRWPLNVLFRRDSRIEPQVPCSDANSDHHPSFPLLSLIRPMPFLSIQPFRFVKEIVSCKTEFCLPEGEWDGWRAECGAA